MPDLPERIGRSMNELDIDFSRFTLAGWCVSLFSLTLGFFVGLAAYWAVVRRIADDRGPALAFGLTMIGVTVVSFLTLRAILRQFSISIIKEREAQPTSQDETNVR